ncbi:integrase [Shewanella frigidimarina]|uniref:integrase n=1 Tax=Shewanella frigidimarina TaxID=56812 RepID=UPI003D793785
MVDGELYDPLISRNFGQTTELKHRNKLLLLMAGVLGLREIELTLVTVSVFIAPDGSFNEFAVLPDTITRDGAERPVVLANVELKKAFEKYIKWLIESGINTMPNKHYLGLNPNAHLFVDDNFKPFTVQKRGESISPHAMNKLLDQLIKNAGLWDAGVRRLSLVRTCVIESYRAGMSTNDIMITTGFSDDSIAKILVMDYSVYSPISEWFIKRKTTKQNRLEAFKRRRKWMI